jgi:hypothetical protein
MDTAQPVTGDSGFKDPSVDEGIKFRMGIVYAREPENSRAELFT